MKKLEDDCVDAKKTLESIKEFDKAFKEGRVSVRDKFVTIDGLTNAKYKLLYDLAAFEELEEKYESIEQAGEALGSGKIAPIIDILIIGLKHYHGEIEKKDLVNEVDLSVIESIAEALSLAMPQTKEETSPKNKQVPTKK